MTDLSEEDQLLLQMNDLMDKMMNYKLDYYRKQIFTSVHVGDFILDTPTFTSSQWTQQQP